MHTPKLNHAPSPTKKRTFQREYKKKVVLQCGPQISVSSQANAAGFKAGTGTCTGGSVEEEMAMATGTDDHSCGGSVRGVC
jgi:hypothetical protein